MTIDFQTISTLVGIVIGLGVIAGVLKGSVDKGTITSLSASVAALQIENDLRKAKIDEQDVRLVALEQENVTLREFVTQKREIAKLTTLLEGHHTETMAYLHEIKEEVAS